MTMMQRRGSSWLGLAGAIALVLAPMPALASKTGSWTVSTPYTSATSNGVTVTMSSTVDFTSVAGGTMMSTNFWNDPYAAVPSASIPGSSNINFIVQPVTTQTVTFTFSKAVNNPVLHIQRLGGSNSGLTNSSNWELTGSNLGAVPTLSRLSGNPQFTVTSNAFYRMPGITAAATGCSAASASATGDDATNGCGTVQINGSGITSLTFTVGFVGACGSDLRYGDRQRQCRCRNPSNCAQSTVTVTVEPAVSAVIGTVYDDRNGNQKLDSGETRRAGWIVEILRDGALIATATTDAQGNYRFDSMLSGSGYSIRFTNPDNNVIYGVIPNLVLANNVVVVDQNLPLDPSGVIYDSISRAPVRNAVVTLLGSNGSPLPTACFLSSTQQNQSTDSSGNYRFDLNLGGAVQCPRSETTYHPPRSG